MVELELVDVRIDEVTKQPFLELKALDGTNRVLPIAVGLPEGAAVKYGLEQRTTPRPMTHDLLGHVLEACGATLDQVVITDFHDQIYFAELHLSIGTDRKTVSCRPSDAIALAVRVGAGIFVNDEVLERQGIALAVEAPAEGGEDVRDRPRLIRKKHHPTGPVVHVSLVERRHVRWCEEIQHLRKIRRYLDGAFRDVGCARVGILPRVAGDEEKISALIGGYAIPRHPDRREEASPPARGADAGRWQGKGICKLVRCERGQCCSIPT